MYAATVGTVIFADNKSKVMMKQCEVLDNGTVNESLGFKGAGSLIEVWHNTELIIEETTFRGNDHSDNYSLNFLIGMDFGSYANINKCTITNNSARFLIDTRNCSFDISNTSFLDNNANVFYGSAGYASTFSDCVFNNNLSSKVSGYASFHIFNANSGIKFIRCDFGNSTFNNRKFIDTDTPNGIGLIFGEGSLTMVIAIVSTLALVASGASIFMITDLKKKLVSTATNNTAENEESLNTYTKGCARNRTP